MAQPLPIHSWKLMVPCEVSAVKLGASSFMRNIDPLLSRCTLEKGTLAARPLRSAYSQGESCAFGIFHFGTTVRASYASPALDTRSLLEKAAKSEKIFRRIAISWHAEQDGAYPSSTTN
jgi:hypothetical protein